ncbi:unnamed protein product [Amoebophrya sp. A120]|nr:unnamed protein product [Amoebophrya sp. A120]|eukprot:GSA120T00006538001.1
MPGKISVKQAVSSVIASMIGAGIFALPQGFAKSGLLDGILISMGMGWLLFTLSAVALAMCCDLCEDIDALRAAGSAPSSAGDGAIPSLNSRGSDYSSLRSGAATPKLGGSRTSQTGDQEPEVEVTEDGRTYLASKPIVDALVMQGTVVEQRIHLQRDAETGRPSMVVVEEGKKIYLLGDIGEKVFGEGTTCGRCARNTLNILASLYLLFACSIFLLLMGNAVQEVYMSGRTLAGDTEAYSERVNKAVWAEAIVFMCFMMLLVQIPDVSVIARVSFIGTTAALLIALLFIVSPILLHVGSGDHSLPKPVVASVWPQQVNPVELVTADGLDADQEGTHFQLFYMWDGTTGPSVYQLSGYQSALENFSRVLESLGSASFGFAFALLVPYLRADMEEPRKMVRVVWISTTVVVTVYVLVVISGLLGIGQKYLLAGDSVMESLRMWETRVEWVNGVTLGHEVWPPVADPGLQDFVLAKKTVTVNNEPVDFYLVRNQPYFFGGGSVGKASLLAFFMSILLGIKLIISYPLTVWPVLQDTEKMLQSCACCRRRRKFQEDEVQPLLVGSAVTAASVPSSSTVRQRGSAAMRGGGSGTVPMSGQSVLVPSERISVRRLELDADNVNDHTYEPLNCVQRCFARIAVVTLTFLLAAVFGAQPGKLGAVMGLTANVPGMLAMVMFPFLGVAMLQGQMRRLTGAKVACRDIALYVLYAVLSGVALILLVYQVVVTPGQIADAYKD